MSYNKFLNKLIDSNNSNYIFQINTKNELIKENKNIQINQLLNEDIKIENKNIVFSSIYFKDNNKNNLIELNTTKNTIIKNDKYLNINSVFKISNDNNNLNLKVVDLNLNPLINIESQNVNIKSNIFKSKKVYGNLQYVDKEKTIKYIQPGQSNNVDVRLSESGGFNLFKKNVNIQCLTYITCDPDDGFSSYDKSDIVSNTGVNNSYNFINQDGIYTNCLYLQLGSNDLTKKKYLVDNEHTFVIDINRSLLPGWGFESTHILNNVDYLDIKSSVMSDIQNMKKSQSIAIDLSNIITNINPGYKFKFIIRKENDQNIDLDILPETSSAFLHDDNFLFSNWQDNIVDTRFLNIDKTELENDLNFKNKFKITLDPTDPSYNKVNHAFINANIDSFIVNDVNLLVYINQNNYTSLNLNFSYNGTVKNEFYPLPYYSSYPLFNNNNAKFYFNLSSGTSYKIINNTGYNGTYGSVNGNPMYRFKTFINNESYSTGENAVGSKLGNYISRFYRQIGTYSENKFVINYFKPIFLLNLGENNIILNENNILSRNIKELKTNVNPYFINKNLIKNKFSQNNDIHKNYFFVNYSYAQNEILNERLDLNNQNSAINDSYFYVNPVETTSANAGNLVQKVNDFKVTNNIVFNLTGKIKKDFINNVLNNKKYYLIKLFPYIKNIINKIWVRANNAGAYNTPFHNIETYLLKTKFVINLPFTNLLKENETIEKFENWLYLNSFKTSENILSNSTSPHYEFNIQDVNLENRPIVDENVDNDIYGISSSINNSNLQEFTYNKDIQEFTLMYIGYNNDTQKHEWIYV